MNGSDWESALRAAHGGWCYTDGGRVIHAVARGPLAANVDQVIGEHGDHAARTKWVHGRPEFERYVCRYHQIVANGSITRSQNQTFGYSEETSRSVLLNQRIPLFTDCTVYVVSGASETPSRTLCRIDGVMLKLGLYNMMEGKIMSQINQDIGEHMSTLKYFQNRPSMQSGELRYMPNTYSVVKMIETDSTRYKSDEISTVAELLERYCVWMTRIAFPPASNALLDPTSAEYIKASELVGVRCNKLASCAAGVILACTVQYYASMDGGSIFRDGRGRTQTSAEYDNSVRILLYQ